MIRPKECITVGHRGTHSVCVCAIHQNVKLMITALPITTTYYDLMKFLVCSLDNKICMLHRCEQCPRTEALQKYLESVFDDNDLSANDHLQYKQWVCTDHTTLQTLSYTLNEFIDNLVTEVDKLTSHHFIAKHQSQHLSTLKQNLQFNEAIMILDFAENYSFVVQDAAQGFHWDNSQATLHPFVAYYMSNEGTLTHHSMCVISDDLKHSTIAVHRFLEVVLQHLKILHPRMTNIHYFSDGAASQYKNYKNLCNLVHHREDFGLDAQWHFFATSHGKKCL